MQSSNLAKFKEIFSIVMDLDEGTAPDELRRASFDNWTSSMLEKWDSMAHMSLVASLESEFDISFEPEDLERMTTFKDIEAVLTEKGL